jgi:hypothetical protein
VSGKYLGVSDVARTLGVRPRQVTAVFYDGDVRDDLCPIVSGRRLIPPDMLHVIAMALRRKGVSVRPVEYEHD